MRTSDDGPHWLDSLARWSARGRNGSRTPASSGLEDVERENGTTRRTALRAAAGAGTVALFAPMRFFEPSTATANVFTHLQECRAEAQQKAQEDSEACWQGPFEDYARAQGYVNEAKQALRNAKSKAEQTRLKKVIKFQTRRRTEAAREMDFCNNAFSSDEAEGVAKCEASVPSPAESGEHKTPTGPGCEAGYLLCGEECCGLSYAFCQGCAGSPICCRIGGNCCPGSE
jgi:hypothetical protein